MDGAARASDPPTGWPRRRTALFATGVLSGIVLAILLVRAHAANQVRKAIGVWEGRLTATADDRKLAIESWLREIRADASLIQSFPTIKSLFNPGGGPTLGVEAAHSETHIVKVLEEVARHEGYTGIYLLNSDGNAFLTAGGAGPLDPSLRRWALRSPPSSTADIRFHRVPASKRYVVAFTFQVYPESKPAGSLSAGRVVLIVEPAEWLFPTLLRERVPTRTGEALLTQREGKVLLFVSPLRNRQNGPEPFALPFDTPGLAARHAVEGKEVFQEFTDYRGIRVLAATRRIRGTDWGLVVKIDREEALASTYRAILLEILTLIAVLCALGVSGYSLVRVQRLKRLKAVLEERNRSEARILQLNRLLRTISEINQLIVREGNRERLLIEACRILAEQGGFEMVWIGLAEPDGQIRPVASAGASQEEMERNTRAVRSCSGSFPLRVRGQAVGALTVRTKNAEGIGEEEQSLLEELVSDLGYALEGILDREERARAEQALHDSEERYRFLFANMLEGVAHCRMLYEDGAPVDFIYLDVNKSFEDQTGLVCVTGRKVSEVIPGIRESSPDLFQTYGRVALTGTPERFETYVEPLAMWFSISAYSPSREHFVAVFEMVNERKRAEQRLLEQYSTLQGIIESAGEVVFSLDTGLRYTAFNTAHTAAMRAAFGTEPALGAEILSLMPVEADRALARSSLNRALSGERHVVETPTGESRARPCFEVSHNPIRRSDGGVIGIAVFAKDVTERRRMEEELKESERRYRLMSENSADVIWTLDLAKRRISYVSPSVYRLRGFSAEEVMGQRMEEVLTPDSFRLVSEILPRRLAAFLAGDDSARSQTTEVEQPRKDGTIVPTEVVTTFVTDDQGRVVELLGISRDITERRRAEAALRDSEERYRALFEHSPAPILEGDFSELKTWMDERRAEGIVDLAAYFETHPEQLGECTARIKVLKVNQSSMALLGHVNRDESSVNLPAHFSENSLPAISNQMVALFAGQTFFRNEIAVRGADGSERLLDLTLAVVPGHEQTLRRVLVSWTDLTERVRDGERVRTLNERLRLLTTAIQELAMAREETTLVEVVRHSARALVGADGITFVGRVDGQCHYLEEDAIKPLWKGQQFPLESCISGWAMLHGEAVVIDDITKDPRVPLEAYQGTFVKSLAMVPVRRYDSLGAIGAYWADTHLATNEEVDLLQTLADATANALENVKLYADMEKRVAERTSALVAANKELEAFTYSVSHDLRAPLRAIDGFSRAVLEDYGDTLDAEGQRLLGVVRTNTQRMSALIDDLLSFSRVGRQEIRHSSVDMEALARMVFEEQVSGTKRENVEFILGRLPEASGDPALLKQVWANLLSNARKYSAGRRPAVIEVQGAVEGGEARYHITDNGVGFDPRYTHKLFGVFQRLHTATEFEGTGAGLAIVKRIVVRHGGRVWAEGRLNEGASFHFAIPVPDIPGR